MEFMEVVAAREVFFVDCRILYIQNLIQKVLFLLVV